MSERYLLYKDVLFYGRHLSSDKCLVCVPKQQIEKFILNFHSHFGHVGPKKCVSAIRDVCYFVSLNIIVRRVVKSCDLCQRTKFSTIRTESNMQHVDATEPLCRVCVDLHGPLPSRWNCVKYIFVVLDCFTRFVRLFPIKKSTSISVTNRMING